MKTDKKIRTASGFTLVEMAIVTILLGVAISAVIPAYDVYMNNKRVQTTRENIDAVTAAIGGFRASYGRYPFPASLNAQRNQAQYGREYNAPMAGGSEPANGVFIQQAIPTRVMNYNDPWTGPKVNQAPRVRIGFVPFRQLGLTEQQAYDGYGNRLVFAVTEHLANATTFQPNQGGIDIIDAQGRTIVPDPAVAPPNNGGTAHFVVYSMGENGAGAYTQGGARLPTPANGALENENSDFDVAATAVFRNMPTSTQRGVQYFDDVFSYFTMSETPLWELSTAPNTVGDIHDKPGGKVGVAFGASAMGFPDASKENQVLGDLRAKDIPDTAAAEGHILGAQLCSSSIVNGGAAECFETKDIAGEIAPASGPRTGGMKCPDDDPAHAGQADYVFMIGVAQGKPICSNQISMKCGPGQIVTGVTASGKLNCAGSPPPGCATEQRTLCASNDVTLTLGPSGTQRTVTAGISRSATYRCQGGSWSQTSVSGLCTCPVNAPQTRSVSCGAGYTGTQVQTRTYQCPPGSWSAWSPTPGTVTATSCLCVATVQTRNVSCPTGGSWQQTRTMICNATNPNIGSWSAWGPSTPPAGACPTCTPTTQTQMVSCGTNYTGLKRQINDYVCPAYPSVPYWTGWRDDPDTSANTCQCAASVQDSQGPCPIGLVGYITNRYQVACVGGVPTQTVTQIENTCALPPPCVWQSDNFTDVSDTPLGVRIGSSNCSCGESRSLCYSGSSGNYQIYQGCVCR